MPRILAAIALVALFSTTIYAQDDDAPIEMEVEKKLVVDVPSAQFASDHASTVGHWGVQVASLDGAPGLGLLPFVGFRKWTSQNQGFEGGIALSLNHEGQPEPLSDTSIVSLGVTGGWMRTLSVHKHLAIFWEPQATLIVVIPDSDSGAENGFVFDGRVNIGGELRLGMLGLKEIGLTTKFSGGFRVAHDGETDFFLGTFGGSGNSVEGLLQATVGFVLYL